jgi:hypothetical protein
MPLAVTEMPLTLLKATPMRFAALAFALAAACTPLRDAAASVIYSFTQTAPMETRDGRVADVVATAVLVVSDEAHAAGFSLFYQNNFALPGTVPPPIPASTAMPKAPRNSPRRAKRAPSTDWKSASGEALTPRASRSGSWDMRGSPGRVLPCPMPPRPAPHQ